MGLNTGKKLEIKFQKWHKGIDCLTFKYPDFASCGTTQKALCDRITITNKGTFFFECKHTESKTSFNLGLIKPHQWRYMIDLERLTNKSYFIIEDGKHNVYLVSPKYLFNFKGKSVKFSFLPLLTKKQFLNLLL